MENSIQEIQNMQQEKNNLEKANKQLQKELQQLKAFKSVSECQCVCPLWESNLSKGCVY